MDRKKEAGPKHNTIDYAMPSVKSPAARCSDSRTEGPHWDMVVDETGLCIQLLCPSASAERGPSISWRNIPAPKAHVKQFQHLVLLQNP